MSVAGVGGMAGHQSRRGKGQAGTRWAGSHTYIYGGSRGRGWMGPLILINATWCNRHGGRVVGDSHLAVWPFPTAIQPAAGRGRCPSLNAWWEPSKPHHAWKTRTERKQAFPPVSCLNDELRSRDKGGFVESLADLAEGLFKLQYLEYT